MQLGLSVHIMNEYYSYALFQLCLHCLSLASALLSMNVYLLFRTSISSSSYLQNSEHMGIRVAYKFTSRNYVLQINWSLLRLMSILFWSCASLYHCSIELSIQHFVLLSMVLFSLYLMYSLFILSILVPPSEL